MGAKQLKGLTVIFGAAIAGIVFCLIMTIYTGVREHQVRQQPPQISIPLPAMGS